MYTVLNIILYNIFCSRINFFTLLNIIILEPDPVYTFTKPLNQQTSGFTKHEVQLECTVSSSMAHVSWYKGKAKLEVMY
jgi:hypothetical protein